MLTIYGRNKINRSQSNFQPQRIHSRADVGTWRALEGSRGRFFLFVVLFICAYSIDLLSPWAIGYTLSVFVERGFGDEALGSALLGVGAYVGIRLVYTVLHHFGRYVQLTVSFSARMKTRNRCFQSCWHFRYVGMLSTIVVKILVGSIVLPERLIKPSAPLCGRSLRA